MPRKIVITGAGAVSAAGNDVASILDAIRAGRSAIAPVTGWDTTGWTAFNGAEIRDFNPRTFVEDRKVHKFIRRTDMLGIHAGSQAIDASGMAAARDTLDEKAAAAFSDATGIYVGSGGGAYQNQYEYFPLLAQSDGNLHKFGEELSGVVNPMWLLRTLPNNVLCHVGIKYNFKGANACITNHSVGGTLAVIEATEALRQGEAERAIAIGHDAPVEPQNFLYYYQCGLMTANSLRPFDAGRDGSIFGEGAAAFALETEGAARSRGATILGEVLGGGYAAEAVGLLAIREDGDGVVRAIRAALDDARLEPDDVGMIVAHANGTQQSDASEIAALKTVFGNRAPPITGFKWAIGHLIAAAGIIEATLALAALRARTVPGIANLQTPDPACAGLPISRDAQVPRSDVALILCRGFAGTDAALLIRAA
jgi:3-oxoacyl-[acyl-carrier-protein] synthase-1